MAVEALAAVSSLSLVELRPVQTRYGWCVYAWASTGVRASFDRDHVSAPAVGRLCWHGIRDGVFAVYVGGNGFAQQRGGDTGCDAPDGRPAVGADGAGAVVGEAAVGAVAQVAGHEVVVAACS